MFWRRFGRSPAREGKYFENIKLGSGFILSVGKIIAQ